ncbi:hypothetical protein B0O99DRAFT_591034 [Bisporella sp. PMI_857]|nr:hypothetical protein B0O99DRAFT_591034 [Bisporella sp. PMI_857]
MPVISEQPYHGNDLPVFQIAYFLVGLLFFCVGLFMSRKSRSLSPSLASPASASEKALFIPQDESQPSALPSGAKPAMPRPLQPPPLTPPTYYTQTGGASESYYSSPVEVEISGSYDSFDSFEPATDLLPSSPKRRSYTKTTPEGGEVSGEIIVAEGWRRHTRVFGGGVCLACEESNRRMTA